MNINYKSQYGQDRYLIETVFNYKEGGYFLEIGTGDGIHISNTYCLEQYLGWSGICVECNPYLYDKVKMNRSCKLSNSPISYENKLVNFNAIKDVGYYNAFFSSLYEIDSDKQADCEIISMQSITLHQLLQQFTAPECIQYLSLDTEGGEYEILNKFFEENDIREIEVISVEHNFNDNKRDGLFKLLSENGYERIHSLDVDDIYKLKSLI